MTITEQGNAALRALIENAKTERRLSVRQLGFYQGELATIEAHLEPERDLIQQARDAIDTFARRINQAGQG